jgi:hypothetical protein
MTAWQIIVGVLTIVMSGVVAAVVTFRLNARREDRQFRRERLEQLFRAFSGFCRVLEVGWSPYINVMAGKIDYNQALDMTIASGEDDERNLENVEMLVAIYWPELQSHVNALKTVRDDASSLLGEHKARYKAGHTRDKESFDAIGQVIRRLDHVRSCFGEVVRAEAAKLK